MTDLGRRRLLYGAGAGAAVAATSGQTIDGAKTYPLRRQHSCVDVVSNGSGWYVTARL